MNYAEWVSAVAAVLALIVAAVSTHGNTKLRLAISQFENTFVDRLNGRYIRKPDNEEDYPVTRREIRILEETAVREHARLDGEIKLVHSRISTIRDTEKVK